MEILLNGLYHDYMPFKCMTSKKRRDMMKYRYPVMIAIFVILIAMAVVGCTTTSPSGPAATATPSGGLTTLGSAIDFNKLHWYEYQMTSTTPGAETSNMKMRFDYNVDYKGQNADKFSMNIETKQGDTTTTMVTESYTDKSGNSLGGHMKTMQGGQVIYEMDIPASSGSTGSSGTSTGTNPLSTNTGASLTGLGADTVTVPAGTFACTKYSWGGSGSTGTVWVAPNVPIPVKMESKSGDTTISMELTGWGA